MEKLGFKHGTLKFNHVKIRCKHGKMTFIHGKNWDLSTEHRNLTMTFIRGKMGM